MLPIDIHEVYLEEKDPKSKFDIRLKIIIEKRGPSESVVIDYE